MIQREGITLLSYKPLREIGLTPTQFFLLGSLSRLTWVEPRGPTQTEVADAAVIDINVASQVLRQLELRGLLVRVRDQQDGRARRLQMSSEGRGVLRRGIALVRRVDHKVFGELDHGSWFADELRRLGE